MSRRANPKLVGGFVLAAIGLAVAAALVFGSFTLFEPTRKFVVFFQGTVDGLAQGSQVLFRGVPVGKVVDIGIRYDPSDSSFAIPVIIEIRPGVIAKYSPPAATLSAEGVKRLTDEGLRARLETSSLVTGQQVVQLNFFPGSPVELAQTDLPYYQLPTLPSPTQQLMSSIETAAQDLPALIKKAEALIERGQNFLSPENETAVHSLFDERGIGDEEARCSRHKSRSATRRGRKYRGQRWTIVRASRWRRPRQSRGHQGCAAQSSRGDASRRQTARPAEPIRLREPSSGSTVHGGLVARSGSLDHRRKDHRQQGDSRPR
jgi:hypothetical protein